MNDKITWYREVLTLEPGSRVFFPLARLLVQSGRPEEAADVLRQGLERNPEFLEARLMLADLEVGQGREAEARREIATIGGILSNYPSFWKKWAATMAEDSPDAALAMRVLASRFAAEPLTWAAILEKGLMAVLAEESEPASPGIGSSRASQEPAPDRAGISPDTVLAASVTAATAAVAAEVVTVPAWKPAEPGPQDILAGPTEGGDDIIELEPSGGAESLESTPQIESPGLGPDDFDFAEAADDTGAVEEPHLDDASLRTRTMADILAGQGDLEGALSIYRDLWAGTQPGPERDGLADCIEDLQARLGEAPSVSAESDDAGSKSEQPAGGEAKPKGGGKLLSTLGALAQRLEARSKSR